MGNNRQEHISLLFEKHAENLQRIFPDTQSTFVCPICFAVFSRDELYQLNTGHIWPEFLRNKGVQAKLLLCSKCNSWAGGRGDAAMQELAKIREGESIGKPYKPRQVLIQPSDDPFNPARLKMYVTKQSSQKITLEIRRRKQDNHWHNDPNEIAKFTSYSKREHCNVIIYPHDINIQLAFSGWLTSAYLSAFYAFGYRYIFQDCLDSVRQYILDSFNGKVDHRLEFSEEKTTCVKICGTHFYNDPTIGFVSPLDGNTHYIEVSFLDFHVRLPTKCSYLPNRKLLPYEANAYAVVIDGTNHIPHADFCHWEILFGEPDFWLETR